jgi:RNA polymerase sigma-70 factor, ECF subfamily
MIEALESLPPDYAMPLRLRFLDEMPLNRIAAFMGIPLSTVKWRIHHGKKLLREKVETTGHFRKEGEPDGKRNSETA